VKELRIFDKVQNKDYLVSLGEIIKVMNRINSSILQGEWEIVQGAYGYGEVICEIEDRLNKGKKCTIKYEELFPLLIEDEQYFYNVTLMKVGSNLSLGIFDSSFLFLRCDDQKILQEVMSNFKKTELVDRP